MEPIAKIGETVSQTRETVVPVLYAQCSVQNRYIFTTLTLMNRGNILYSCLYTPQKTKKKKSWLDGQVHIYLSQKKCVLYKWDGSSAIETDVIDSMYCSGLEIDRILHGQADSLEFDKFLVEIDRCTPVADTTSCDVPTRAPLASVRPSYLSKPKLTKFQLPKTVIPLPPTPPASTQRSTTNHSTNLTKGFYSIDDDELDNIWASVSYRGTSSGAPRIVTEAETSTSAAVGAAQVPLHDPLSGHTDTDTHAGVSSLPWRGRAVTVSAAALSALSGSPHQGEEWAWASGSGSGGEWDEHGRDSGSLCGKRPRAVGQEGEEIGQGLL